MALQPGDVAPEFEADTTEGPVHFVDAGSGKREASNVVKGLSWPHQQNRGVTDLSI